MATAPKNDVSAAALSAALAAPAVEKDEFADAFAKFATPEETPAVQAAEEAAAVLAATTEGAEPVSEIEGAPEAGAEGEGEDEPELPLEGGEGGKPAAKPAKAAKEAPAPADEALTRLADMIAQRQPQPQPQPTPQPAAAPPLYTQAEAARLTEFYKEWPEVAPAVEIIVRGAITQTTNHIFAEMAKVLGPKMALLDQLADGYQDGLLREVVPDYDDTIPEQVSAWIKGQPKYLQAAYSNVMNEGTVDEINDLVSRYRQETGTAAPNADRTSEGIPQAPAKPAATLSTAAKKAAAALAPVSSKRAAVTVGAPQTFDEAFDFHANRKAG